MGKDTPRAQAAVGGRMSRDPTYDGERAARNTPALPGDVVDYGGGYERIVRYARLRHEVHRQPCGCCLEDEYIYEVFVEADEPVEVILAGGGKALVLPIVLLCDDWPPPDADVVRNGKIVYNKKNLTDDKAQATSPAIGG